MPVAADSWGMMAEGWSMPGGGAVGRCPALMGF